MGAACGGGERKVPVAPETRRQDPEWMKERARRQSIDMGALRRTSVSAPVGFRLPVIGVLQGRLTEDQLMDIWDRYDTKAEGTIKTGATVPLVREIIFSIPDLLKASFDSALEPLQELARQTGDEKDTRAYEEAKAELSAQVDPELYNLSRQIKGMDEATLGILIERLVELMDLDNDGSVDLEEYLDVFAPKSDSTFQKRYEAKMQEIRAAQQEAEAAAREEDELEDAEDAAMVEEVQLDEEEKEEKEEKEKGPDGGGQEARTGDGAADDGDDDDDDQVDVEAVMAASAAHKRKPSFAGSAADE